MNEQGSLLYALGYSLGVFDLEIISKKDLIDGIIFTNGKFVNNIVVQENELLGTNGSFRFYPLNNEDFAAPLVAPINKSNGSVLVYQDDTKANFVFKPFVFLFFVLLIAAFFYFGRKILRINL
jgi:hypothetical protein